MPLSRRRLLRSTAAVGAGAMVLTQPFTNLAALALDNDDDFGTSRVSRLFPGPVLVHADLHNHSHLSDGDGDAATFYPLIRDAGVDVAALTDHATLQWGPSGTPGADVCQAFGPLASDCKSVAGLTNDDWAYTAQLAAEFTDEANGFLGVRGFEWSSPVLGHVNVWFTDHWIDPLHTVGLIAPAAAESYIDPDQLTGPLPGPLATVLETIVQTTAGIGDTASMAPFQQWLAQPQDTPLIGGGQNGVAGFNHPGREPGRFGGFTHEPSLQDTIVSMEILNKRDDYLFEGVGDGRPSPIIDCLRAGWTPGLMGASDEHGTDWGSPLGKGRGGLWINGGVVNRAAVQEALLSRRFYAARVKGLRMDTSLNGVRMGETLGHPDVGPVRVQLDLDRGPASWGREVRIQVLATPADPDQLVPDLLHVEVAPIPRPDQPVIEFVVDGVDPSVVKWLVLRISGPNDLNGESLGINETDGEAGTAFAGGDVSWAYSSPVHLDPTLEPPAEDRAPLTRQPDPDPNPTGPPTTGGGGGGQPDPQPSPTPTPTPTPGPDEPGGVPATVRRRGGDTRVDTAAEVSRFTFTADSGVPVFVAGADALADALSAGPAATAIGPGPLLLVTDEVPEATAAELRRLATTRIVLLGGTAAVSSEVEEALGAFADVERIGGPTRFATSALISEAAFDTDIAEVWVVNGERFGDTLAGGAAAARAGAPLLLVTADTVPAEVDAELRRLAPDRIVLLGGSIVVGSGVEATLADVAPVTRLAGPTRVHTAAMIAEHAFPDADHVMVVSGEAIPDALSATPAAFMRMAPVLLVDIDDIPDATDAQLRRLGAQRITVVGGTAAVSDAVLERLRAYEVS
ncbi:MAG: cell wall-binding repeat-containing protein [Actinomycetota bacterium]